VRPRARKWPEAVVYWRVCPPEKPVAVSKLLQLNVGRLRGNTERIDRHLEPSVLASEGEAYRIVEPVDLGFTVHRIGERFRLEGSVASTLVVACSRCLEPYRVPVEAQFDLSYAPHAENTGEGELEVEDDDLTTAFYRDDVIELDQLIREQFYLALPMKPLCTDECKGLCPQCGKNLNAGPCDCRDEWEDPRLAALKSVLKRES
jgi:uncharacterized protein